MFVQIWAQKHRKRGKTNTDRRTTRKQYQPKTHKKREEKHRQWDRKQYQPKTQKKAIITKRHKKEKKKKALYDRQANIHANQPTQLDT